MIPLPRRLPAEAIGRMFSDTFSGIGARVRRRPARRCAARRRPRRHALPLRPRTDHPTRSDRGRTTADHTPEVLFVCVHNAGRSQMAAALLHHHAAGRVRITSAGSAPADEINPVVRNLLHTLVAEPAVSP